MTKTYGKVVKMSKMWNSVCSWSRRCQISQL